MPQWPPDLLETGKIPHILPIRKSAMTLVRATLVAAIAAAVVLAVPARVAEEAAGLRYGRSTVPLVRAPSTGEGSAHPCQRAPRRSRRPAPNTPGGLATSMREIVADVVGARVPVTVTWRRLARTPPVPAPTSFTPRTRGDGARHQPRCRDAVPIGGPLPGVPDKNGKARRRRRRSCDGYHVGEGDDDVVALIRSLAESARRNADWAEKAVREAASLSAGSALQAGVIDFVARNPAELLQQVDGRSIELTGGETRTLSTKGVTIEVLIRLADPAARRHHQSQCCFLLLIVGIYGLIFEFTTPGVVAAGHGRRDLPAARGLWPAGVAGQLRRRRADRDRRGADPWRSRCRPWAQPESVAWWRWSPVR